MNELLISIIMTVCPQTSDLNNCQEFIVNCSVDKSGNITQESIDACLKRYQNERRSKGSENSSDI